MGFTNIAIRDDTYAALAKLRTKAFEHQEGVALDLSLSDVIDTLVEIAMESADIDVGEVLEAIAITGELKLER